jgi:cell division protein FtsB
MKIEVDSQAELMRRYLLGALPEAEQLRLEERFFADSETLEQIWAVENELIDAYVRDQLTGAERAQFERHYLAAPDHRERVAFARELLHVADETGAAEAANVIARAAPPAESFWTKLLASLRAPQFALGAAAAAVLLLLAGGWWFINERARWREQAQAELRAAEQQRLEQEKQLAQQRARTEALNAELERLRQQPSPVAPTPAPRASVFSFLLLPTIRGGEQQPTLKIPPGTDQVRFQMKLERNDYPRYQVSLRPVDGGATVELPRVNVVSRRAGALVSVNLPAAKLTRGDYILTLTGVDSSGATEQVNRYFFRVSK